MPTTVITPTALASRLAGEDQAQRVAKSFVRPFLRKNFPRAKDAKGTGWNLDKDQVKAIEDAWEARQAKDDEVEETEEEVTEEA